VTRRAPQALAYSQDAGPLCTQVVQPAWAQSERPLAQAWSGPDELRPTNSWPVAVQVTSHSQWVKPEGESSFEVGPRSATCGLGGGLEQPSSPAVNSKMNAFLIVSLLR
jgi:hypothetical protein